MNLNTKLSDISGVGPVRAQQLAALGLNNVGDLLCFFPRKYEDYSNLKTVAAIRPGLVSLEVKIHSVSARRVRRGLHITEAIAKDPTGQVKIVWFNQPYRASSLKSGETYLLRGEYGLNASRLQIINPSLELKNDTLNFQQSILPIYKESKTIKSPYIRKLVKSVYPCFSRVKETLPENIVKTENLMSKNQAYLNLHLPQSAKHLDQAIERMGFEEVFILMLGALLNRQENLKLKSVPVKFDQKEAKNFVSKLPFKLTDDQRRIVWQIYQDIAKEVPMNRLVEGDVGSGKTVVAAMAALMLCRANLQVALLAPTELLAQQHYQTIKNFFAHSAYADQIELLTGRFSAQHKRDIKSQLQNHKIRFLIGTHAILQKDIDWHSLGLVIIDEQHRFGVEQRQKITLKAGHMPHILCLTATPIPRSLALTLYGELDVSVLASAPRTKAGVDTELISPNSTSQMYDKVRQSLAKGRQTYVVCPLVEQSDQLKVASVEETYALLSKTEFKNWRVGLLHGRMKSADKELVMKKFRDREIDVMVSTTVIEVGVDVPNATEMIILDANRFGLAQLHQLRGRVGRGEHKGTCFLVMSDSLAPSKRMRAIAANNNGFELAEIDLDIRGPGAIYGTAQHGALDLNFAKITDVNLINKARKAIASRPELIKNMVKYKQLYKAAQKASKLTYLN